MRLTGTFLDEISFDIPHQNWGYREWDRDFAAMSAIGIRRVILIRAANAHFMTFPSKVIPAKCKALAWHKPPVDLIDMFLELAEKHGLQFFAGTMHSGNGNCVNWTEAQFKEEAAFNKELIHEIQEGYGHRKAFAGWYLTHEVCANHPGVIELFNEQGAFAHKVSDGKPTLISPYFAGVKVKEATCDPDAYVLSVEQHEAHWRDIFKSIKGNVDIVAFQDGHVNYDELHSYLKVTKVAAEEQGIQCWSNIESFDRDMPIRFLPIKWEKFLWKMEEAEMAGVQEAITFEFSHFMSPNSMYPSAHGLYDRYSEYCGFPTRSSNFS